MRRRRQQKLEKKLQQFRSKDGGPDTGGTLKIYGEALCRDVPYKTLLLSIDDCAAFVVEEMLDKYGKDRRQAHKYCLVQATTEVGGGGPQGDGAAKNSREYYLDDDECPLAILMNHPPSRGMAEEEKCLDIFIKILLSCHRYRDIPCSPQASGLLPTQAQKEAICVRDRPA